MKGGGKGGIGNGGARVNKEKAYTAGNRRARVVEVGVGRGTAGFILFLRDG